MSRTTLVVVSGLVLFAALWALNQLVRRPEPAARAPAPPDSAALQTIPEHPDTALEARIAAIAAGTRGRIGVAAKHLRTGAVARFQASTPLPLMSVVKLPVALAVLDGVDRGRWTLDSTILLLPEDMNPSGPLGREHPRGGAALTIHALTDVMITMSDNSAADALMRLMGGPRSVTAWLEARGLRGVRVDRTELELGNDWYGLDHTDTTWTLERIRGLRSRVTAAVRDSAARALASDPRDTGTAAGLVQILERLWRGDLLSAAMTDTLRAMLGRCATSPGRLPGALPEGTPAARKTGTGGTWRGVTVAVNDVGVIRLPDGEEVAIAVLVADVRGSVEASESTIARIARAVYDAWGPPKPSGALGVPGAPSARRDRASETRRLASAR